MIFGWPFEFVLGDLGDQPVRKVLFVRVNNLEYFECIASGPHGVD